MEIEEVIHSRFDRDHYKDCEPCYEDHLDFEDQCRIDEEMDEKEYLDWENGGES